ncbi:DUF2878 family protein [Candidatus Woesearchaeota archaeon]|nr:DUF2878 family protein [Candidatus Woesearchaeota archaeon]
MKQILKAFIYSLLLGFIALYSVSQFWEKPLELTLGLLSLSALMLLISKKKEDLVLFVVCGASGAIAEIIGIFFGAWNYSLPQLGIIPYWLPILWGIAALFVKRTSQEIDDFFKKKTK